MNNSFHRFASLLRPERKFNLCNAAMKFVLQNYCYYVVQFVQFNVTLHLPLWLNGAGAWLRTHRLVHA